MFSRTHRTGCFETGLKGADMEFRDDITLGMKVPLLPPLMNGGGCCKYPNDAKILAQSSAGAIVYGSITWDERTGNPGNVWEVIDDTGFNSLGMPNPGRLGM